jgi:pimeloyl-ACP methyl ester carboxylesterase
MKTHDIRYSLLSVVLLCAAGMAQAATPNAASCAALKNFKMPGHALTITGTEWKVAGPVGPPPGSQQPFPTFNAPAHCRVDGALDNRIGVDGKPYAIKFAVALPANWNGRFLFQGGGGLNGSVNPPLGMQSGGSPALARGFAVASTDSGHSGAGFDASFFADQEAALNFLFQAVGKVTVVSKGIVGQFFGKRAHHNYYVGCSTGGREAMMMSQRFPTEYDGIVAGAPAMRTNYSNLGLRWVHTALNAIAPKDAQGRPQTAKALSDDDRKLVIDGFLNACDALDGARDGLVFATQRCAFDPAVLACSGAKNNSCLTTDQVGAVKKAMLGARDFEGRQVYPGYYYDTGIAATQGLAGLLIGPMIPEGPAASTTMNVDADAAAAHDGRAMLGDTNAWTNLSTFRGRGGKLIFYHGVSDPWFSAKDTVRYYEQLAKDNGPTPVNEWSRMFLVPGMGHCRGGAATLDSFDFVDAIVNWVEQKQAPESVVATGASMPGQGRPLCSFPKFAQYVSGDAKNAASYRCAE